MGVSPGALNTSRSSPEITSGPSPLGEAGKEFGCSDDDAENMKKNNQHYLTLVYHNRRQSDNALVGIMLDPILSHLFRSYLYKYFKEALYNFWSECNSYTLIHSGNIETKKSAAAHIYSTFLAPDAPYLQDFQLDAPTRDQITADLLVNKTASGEYKVKQNSEKVLKDVFRFPAAKVFQILKFDYFAEFLLSDEFRDNADNFGHRSSNKEAGGDGGNRKVRDEIVDIETVIKQPSGMHYFLKFARANGLFGGQAQFVFDLLYEMNHYDDTEDPATKMKRLKKIVIRYRDFNFLIEVGHLAETAKKNNYKEPDRDGAKGSLLDNLRAEIMQLLDNYSLPFKMSEEYREFKASKTLVQSEVTVKKVKEYAKSRSLEPKTKIDFKELLRNRIGRAYFKKYAEKNLMQESMGFWLAVEALQDNVDSMRTKKVPPEEIHSFIHIEAENLIKNFIEEGAEQQVNISDAQRAATLELFQKFKNGEVQYSDVFEIASREILELLKRNLWNGFRGNKQFLYLSEKLLEKDTKKNRFGLTCANIVSTQ